MVALVNPGSPGTKAKFNRFNFKRCPECGTDIHGSPWVCPNCGWNSEHHDVTFVLGDLVVRMAGGGKPRPLMKVDYGE